MSASDPAQFESIDGLLKEYLKLLDEYQSERQQLTASLSAGYLSLAQANFSPASRIRYGQDFYDDRMQASQRILLRDRGKNKQPTILVIPEGDTGELEHETPINEEMGPRLRSRYKNKHNDAGTTSDTAKHSYKKDPLHWFGILVPPALRSAQASFSAVVSEIVPRMLSVDQDMKTIEEKIVLLRREREARKVESI
ncbi:MAG: hypothetical protein M1825_004818 [Sarcosagium campestre]|nr:MAG: hypothetical protein M1825_004818 [Sarcosagium campestre]